MKRAILIIAIVTTGLSGCSADPHRPHCDDPTGERAIFGVLSLGVSELIREIELDCSYRSYRPNRPRSTGALIRDATDLIEDGDAAERFSVGFALWSRGETELGDHLICLSAHQRLQDAQDFLARRYQYGRDRIDLVQAYKWYEIAYYGAEYADEKRAELTPKMTPEQIAEAERLVAEWEPNPAECEVIEAQSEN